MDLDKPEKAIISVIIGVFILSSVNLLSALGKPITREEAIEISRNSELVKEGLAIARGVSISATYDNSSMIEQLKLGHNRKAYEKVPEGHGAWTVVWTIYKDVGGYLIIVIVDAETGIIIHETKGVEFG